MKSFVRASQLAEALGRLRAVDSSGASYVQLEAKESGIELISCGPFMSAKYALKLEKPAVETLIQFSGVQVLEYVLKLDQKADVSFISENGVLELRQGRSVARFSLIPVRNKLTFSTENAGAFWTFPGLELGKLFGRLSQYLNESDARFYAQGSLLELDHCSLVGVSTDGLRLFREFLNASEFPSRAVVSYPLIPKKALAEISSYCANMISETVRISFDDREFSFEHENFSFRTKTIQGAFPPWWHSVPSKPEKAVSFQTQDLKEALGRVLLFAEKNSAVRFSFDATFCRLRAKTDGLKEVEDFLAFEGCVFTEEIVFNGAHLLDALKLHGGEKVSLSCESPGKPWILKNEKDRLGFTVLVPMRF
jgi:DNA polymerase-3 subunit beta